jgi:hypothetical protein
MATVSPLLTMRPLTKNAATKDSNITLLLENDYHAQTTVAAPMASLARGRYLVSNANSTVTCASELAQLNRLMGACDSSSSVGELRCASIGAHGVVAIQGPVTSCIILRWCLFFAGGRKGEACMGHLEAHKQTHKRQR